MSVGVLVYAWCRLGSVGSLPAVAGHTGVRPLRLSSRMDGHSCGTHSIPTVFQRCLRWAALMGIVHTSSGEGTIRNQNIPELPMISHVLSFPCVEAPQRRSNCRRHPAQCLLNDRSLFLHHGRKFGFRFEHGSMPSVRLSVRSVPLAGAGCKHSVLAMGRCAKRTEKADSPT